MVRSAATVLTGALLLAVVSPLAYALPFPTNTTEFITSDQLTSTYDGLGAQAHFERRYLTNLSPPSGYTSSWGIDGYRVSYGPASGQYISRSTISGATKLSQTQVNACATLCNKDSRCRFFHPVEMRGNSEGNVICTLYTAKQERSTATWSGGPGSTGGSVVASYGFTRNIATTTRTTSTTSSSTSTRSTSTTSRSTSTTSRSTSTTSRSTSTTSTATTSRSTSSTSATPTLPAPPAGARLVQFRGCASSQFTVPMFVNVNFPVDGFTTSDTAWIVQHGSNRNFDDYFSSVRNVVGDRGVIIAPNLYSSADSGKWYQPSKNLAWNSNDWANGADAVAPSGVSSCSSYDIYDSLVALLDDRAKFPNLQKVYVVAHSGGASMMTKYSVLRPTTGYSYVLANSPSMPYFTNIRPNSTNNCPNYNTWGYGFGSPLPRYVAARLPNGVQGFRSWVAQDITLMTGDFDTYSRDQTGDQSCPVQSQGGQNRRDRGYAWWAYINLLGGTSTDVSDYYGYQSLKDQGVTSLNPPSFGVRYCVVDGVAHDNDAMFASDCGRAAITGASTLPPGPGPVRPA
ncbi:uncharacterized protein UMAG_06440 [Mycosarcoma maydis]|uniref:Apple domain-containing protein n=1 Tax=Mycosarcoma maydis TaxID=5270 RepID=A0A0D1DT47_MYCMD|nr:uncharacterized protein UMAG_06440 [Ustilago maydis 521]KIS65735.1 hypothetical protein UMAG_06440 [Ustilago maydis 521]|eukprot:XP_011392717.1 hypothetical protein UMAG_06440 [Ustilago maydis 521]